MLKFFILIFLFISSGLFSIESNEILEAVRDGNIPGLKKLIKSKAKLDFVNSREMTPLMIASADNNLEIVKILVEAGANINIKNNENGKNALMYAASLGYFEVCDYLISQKGMLIDAKDKEGKTALMHAVFNARKEVVQLLIEKKANVHARTNTEESALSLAMRGGRAEIIKILKDFGARE
jgi:ankyrin repeat protein